MLTIIFTCRLQHFGIVFQILVLSRLAEYRRVLFTSTCLSSCWQILVDVGDALLDEFRDFASQDSSGLVATDGSVLDTVRSKKSTLEIASTSHSLVKSGRRCASTTNHELSFTGCLDYAVPALVNIK